MSIKNIANSLNTYVESKDYKYIEEIEDYFKSLFSVEYVKFWKYDSRDEILVMLEDKNNKIKSLTTSVTKQAIDSKSTVLSNHIISDKSFSSEVDNPLSIKMKALIVFPIVKNNKVLGVLKLWKGMKQRKVFSKQDENKLETFIPLLIKIIETKSIEKDELLTLMGDESSKSVTKTKEVKSPIAVKEKPKRETTSKVELELEALKKEFDKNVEEQRVLEENFLQLKNELKQEEDKYKDLESSSLEFSQIISEHQKINKELTDKVKNLSDTNKGLKEDLKKDKKTKSIKELKSENAVVHHNKSISIEDNMEYIFDKVAPVFSENEYSHLLFELMVYAFHSKSCMSDIEDILRKSRVLPDIIEAYYFQGAIKTNYEKQLISDFSKNIQKYGKNIFLKTKVNIIISKDVPSSLVLDAPKIQNIIFHLLLDMYQFVDNTKDLNINFLYKNKLFIIEINGAIHQDNSLFKSMFKQTTLGGNEKDRLGLLLSQKLIERLKGKIESIHDDTHYKFVLSVPTQKIKM